MYTRRIIREFIRAAVDFADHLWGCHPLVILAAMAILAGVVWLGVINGG